MQKKTESKNPYYKNSISRWLCVTIKIFTKLDTMSTVSG